MFFFGDIFKEVEWMGPLVKLGRDFTRPGPLKGSFLEGKSLAIFRQTAVGEVS